MRSGREEGREEQEEEDEEEEEAVTDIKSNNPHLTGGEILFQKAVKDGDESI